MTRKFANVNIPSEIIRKKKALKPLEVNGRSLKIRWIDLIVKGLAHFEQQLKSSPTEAQNELKTR
jgi:hypothetical protein